MLLEVKSGCPITTLAAIPFVGGCLYSRTRLLKVSATQIFPSLSVMALAGSASPLAAVACAEVVKLSCPNTVLAASPVLNGESNKTTRLLKLSATSRNRVVGGGIWTTEPGPELHPTNVSKAGTASNIAA